MKKIINISGKLAGKLGLAALAAAMSPLVMAQQDAGWYGGLSVGRSMSTIDDARITAQLKAMGLATTSIADRDRSTGYKIFGGYDINRNLAVEAGIFDLGKFGFTATTAPPGTLTGDIRLQGLNLDLVGKLPVTEKFSVMGRIGVANTRAQDRFAGTGAVIVTNPSPSKRETNLKLGLGMGYDFSESLGARLELERYRINDAIGNRGHVDLVSVGLVYRFGRSSAPMPVRAEPAPMPAPVIAQAPVYVAPLPAPAPPPAPPAVMAPTKVSLSADSLFAFDRSAVSPGGKQQLDTFVRDLTGTSYDQIKVTGHTDRLGSHDYNMKLSAERANAVSTYLTTSGGIPAAKIAATGVNGSDPVTKPGDCKGNKPTPQLIACLQPDRRVDVEVTGTRR
jgi:OOP family OmpA-OmpF porin